MQRSTRKQGRKYTDRNYIWLVWVNQWDRTEDVTETTDKMDEDKAIEIYAPVVHVK